MRKMLSLVVLSLLVAAVAQAGVAVIGKGDQAKFDPAGIPANLKENFKVMEVKCNNKACHSLGRVVEAVTTGIAPNSKTPFDKEAAKRYGIKMMRKPDSGVNKDEAKQVVELLYYLIDEARK